MNRDELVAYFNSGGDISELLRDGTTGPDLGPMPAPDSIPMIVTGVRLPTGVVRRLDQFAGNDKGGEAARRLLQEDTLGARDRLAGLLDLLYAQPVARISRLTTDQVTTDDTTVRIRLGTASIALPEPVADFTRQLLTGKHGHATTGRRPPLTLAVPR